MPTLVYCVPVINYFSLTTKLVQCPAELVHTSMKNKALHRQSQCTTHTHSLSSPATVTFDFFHPNSYTPTRGASRSRLPCVAHLTTLASTVFQLSCVKSYIQTDGACRYTSLHYVVVCNYISLKHIFTQPVGSLMSSCCSRSVTDSLSIRSTIHLRCDSRLMAA